MNPQLVQESLARVVWSGAGLTLTLREVLLALALVLGGGLASRLVAALFRRRIAPRMAASRQTRELAPRWIFLGLWALFLLAALRVLGVPLTVFNFLGGAIALGFGFGAQNLCSNLISGAIILVARPDKVKKKNNGAGLGA